MTKGEAMYQTWLVIGNLEEEVKNLIPQNIMDEITRAMEFDSRIVVNPDVPIEYQNLDKKTWDMLERILKIVEKNGYKKIFRHPKYAFEMFTNCIDLIFVKENGAYEIKF